MFPVVMCRFSVHSAKSTWWCEHILSDMELDLAGLARKHTVREIAIYKIYV